MQLGCIALLTDDRINVLRLVASEEGDDSDSPTRQFLILQNGGYLICDRLSFAIVTVMIVPGSAFHVEVYQWRLNPL